MCRDSRSDVGDIIQEEGNLKIEETKILENQVLLGGYLEVKILYVSDDGERQIHSWIRGCLSKKS